METATAVAEQTAALVAIATAQSGAVATQVAVAQAMATQTALQSHTVSADALQVAQILGPGLAPLVALFWLVVLWLCWRPMLMVLRRFNVIPPVR